MGVSFVDKMGVVLDTEKRTIPSEILDLPLNLKCSSTS